MGHQFRVQRAAQLPFMEAIAGKDARPISRTDIHAVIEETPPSVNPADLIRYDKFAGGGK